MNYADRIQETTTTAGTGAVSMGGAVAGYNAFSTMPTGTQVPYCITDGTAWEVGFGTLTAGTPWTMSRDVLLGSSTGALLVLSGGSSTIFCDFPANAADWPTINTIIAATDVVNIQKGRQLLVATNLNVLGTLNALGDVAIL
jgi:hypothetical protein